MCLRQDKRPKPHRKTCHRTQWEKKTIERFLQDLNAHCDFSEKIRLATFDGEKSLSLEAGGALQSAHKKPYEQTKHRGGLVFPLSELLSQLQVTRRRGG